MAKKRKRHVLVGVETSLTKRQIEAHGATLYLLEGSEEPECCEALSVEVVPPGATVVPVAVGNAAGVMEPPRDAPVVSRLGSPSPRSPEQHPTDLLGWGARGSREVGVGTLPYVAPEQGRFMGTLG